jgi:hypothetical protein
VLFVLWAMAMTDQFATTLRKIVDGHRTCGSSEATQARSWTLMREVPV